MRLVDALRIQPGMSVAFVGAGGKSSAIRRLVDELTPNIPVIVTTTTKIARQQSDLADSHSISSGFPDPDDLAAQLQTKGSLLVTGPAAQDEPKWLGLENVQLAPLRNMGKRLGAVLLIEADGARRRSLKAPTAHEPVIPGFVDLVVPVAGVDAVGARLSEARVHRPERLAIGLGLKEGAMLSARHVAEALTSPEMGLKGIPSNAEVRLLINKISVDDDLEVGRSIATKALITDRVQSVLLGSVQQVPPVLETHGRVGGVVLAAGGSMRLQRMKQLVSWRGRPLVWHAVQAARSGGLSPIVVVLGAERDKIRESLTGEEVIFVENPDWEQGQSTSVKAGLSAIVESAEGVVFLLADMPMVGADLVRALVERHRSTLAPVIAPQFAGRRANPVLFDRALFPELLQLEGDTGGRALFERYPVESIAWSEDVFLDVDTTQDLDRLQGLKSNCSNS
ncbi:MAG TPA: putative selenium-dependent hydroxylase accessory protein YqeC [Anaerolineae bacterium]|nr:putative selenium-dependent hydroxylase accessory protein YqeC [Anaerolineae bacterium]